MKRIGGLIVSLILTTAPGASAQSSETVFAIERVRVFDGVNVLESATVLIQGDSIVGIGVDVAVPASAHRIDGIGRTLLPGLIDAHVHTLGQRAALNDAARFGVTTVMEMLSEPRRMKMLREKIEAAPSCTTADYFTSGAGATVPGGHGHFSDQYPTLRTAEEAEAFVRDRISEGSQYIKIFVERGFPGRPVPTLDSATVRALVDAAHAHGQLAIVHATRIEDVRTAIEAGADGLAHLWQGGVSADLVRLAQEREVFVIPTLSMIESMIDSVGSEAVLGDTMLARYLTAQARDGLVPERAGRLPGGRQPFFDVVLQLNSAGIPILAGTDAPNPGLAHGASLHRELELLVRAGLSAVEALRAATSAVATAFGLSAGARIGIGERADLVLVEGDPTTEITDTRRIVAVWKCGKQINREVATGQ